jgi:hypothetical protein
MTSSLQAEGLCLRFPENLPPHPNLTHEVAVQMLGRAVSLATQIAFQPSYIDKPPGAASLSFPPLRAPISDTRYRWPNFSPLYPRWRQLSTRWHPLYGARASLCYSPSGWTRT